MKKNNTLISLLICILFNGFLFAEDCYVLAGANPEIANGSEQYPYSTIRECKSSLDENDNSDTIYVGPGHYNVTNLDLRYINVVGSGANVTKIHSLSNDHCFRQVRGTIKNLSFDNYEYFTGGTNTVVKCRNCIEFEANNAYQCDIKVINVLFKSYSNTALNFNYNPNSTDNITYEIINNVFDNTYSGTYDINFLNHDEITFMNNLVLNDISFSNVSSLNNKFHNNLFLSNCSLPSYGVTTYNLVYSGNQVNYNGSYYGGHGDATCGQLGEYQESSYFNNFSDLNLLVNTWNTHNIYASGENTILFDKGNPDTEFNDADGSRSDIGVMGGLHPWPYSSGPIITNFSADPINVQIDGQININSRAQTE